MWRGQPIIKPILPNHGIKMAINDQIHLYNFPNKQNTLLIETSRFILFSSWQKPQDVFTTFAAFGGVANCDNTIVKGPRLAIRLHRSRLTLGYVPQTALRKQCLSLIAMWSLSIYEWIIYFIITPNAQMGLFLDCQTYFTPRALCDAYEHVEEHVELRESRTLSV